MAAVRQCFQAAFRRGLADITAGFAGGAISDENAKPSRRSGRLWPQFGTA